MSLRVLAVLTLVGAAGVAVAQETVSGPERQEYTNVGPIDLIADGCWACHALQQKTSPIPRLDGTPADDFLAAMNAYVDGTRRHPIMTPIVHRLSRAEIEGLAAYYAAKDAYP